MSQLGISGSVCHFPGCIEQRRSGEPFCEAHWQFVPAMIRGELRDAHKRLRDGLRAGDHSFSGSLHRYLAICQVARETIAKTLHRRTSDVDCVPWTGGPKEFKKMRVFVDGAEIHDVVALDQTAGWVRTLARDEKRCLILLGDGTRVATRRIESTNIRVEKRS